MKNKFLLWTLINVFLLGLYVYLYLKEGNSSIIVNVIGLIVFLSFTIVIYLKYFSNVEK